MKIENVRLVKQDDGAWQMILPTGMGGNELLDWQDRHKAILKRLKILLTEPMPRQVYHRGVSVPRANYEP